MDWQRRAVPMRGVGPRDGKRRFRQIHFDVGQPAFLYQQASSPQKKSSAEMPGMRQHNHQNVLLPSRH